ncbi:hypothetical protein AK812_SmicGene35207 [Symbiodinium microadriaticum]|uniref:DUF1995 domain-containing protein n=1 Tax=Symbiodinium microadriaticum TaxID=2951 RepID=A0A1Q9CM58_SYMMI|nr:hypothetical protein AK812_SmicGene35207 [Symbiodinium microadriaticum]
MASLMELGRVALDVVLAVGPMVSSENVAKTHHVVQMRHSRIESFREDVRDMLTERLDSSQNLTLKSTLLFGFVAAMLVEGFPPQKMQSELYVDVFIFLVPWGICLLFQSMTFAVLYQRGMMTVGQTAAGASAFCSLGRSCGWGGGSPASSLTEEAKLALAMREEMVQATVDASSPVPQSFDQAVNWACSAFLRATAERQMRQSMYFNTGTIDNQVSGELGNVLQFAERFAKTLAMSPRLPQGKGVRVLFTDFGAMSLVSTRWNPLPENLTLDHLPPVLPKMELKMEEKTKIEEFLESSMLLIVAPNQSEMAAVLAIFEIMKETGKTIPVVLLNAKLLQDSVAAAGVMLRNFRSMEGTLLPIFHLEQFEPDEDKDPVPLNPAVIVRVWPRPFSVWEDNAEDPEAIDGYFLLDVNDQQDYQDLMTFLKGSREMTKRMRLKERQQREAGGHRHLRELQILVSQQAEEEQDQCETFYEIVGEKWQRSRKHMDEKLHSHTGSGARQMAGLAVSAAWGLVARIFAFSPSQLPRVGASSVESDSDNDWHSISEPTGKLESSPSRIELDYLTMELHAQGSMGRETSDQAKSGSASLAARGLPKHVTEMSNMPEVQALELYEDQAHRTVVGGSFFTILCLGFLVVFRLHMRCEHYTDHAMAFYARLGIFLPPLLVAAFANLIRPYPEKHHSLGTTGKDLSSPTYVMAATHCAVLLAVVISLTSLAAAVQLHAPPPQLSLRPLRASPVSSLVEWSVEWPMFFNPTAILALEEDSLILTTDFRAARFRKNVEGGLAKFAVMQWPRLSYRSKSLMRLMDTEDYPHRIRGFTPLDSNAVMKFACGLGVAVYHADGGLAAIWPLGQAKLLPEVRERVDGRLVSVPGPPELGSEYFTRPNMRPADGYHVKYGRGGDLRWIITCKDGSLNGLQLRFTPEGVLRPQDSGVFQDGKLVERFQESLLPDGFICHVLSELVLPVKKALGLGLSPCEERLCYENFVDVDDIAPADLNHHTDEPESVKVVSARTDGYGEWWRPQVQLRDPGKVYNSVVPYEFAPIGPSVSMEVSPFRPPVARQECTSRTSAALRDADHSAILQEEQPLPGMEINGAAAVNNSVLLAGRQQLHHFSAGPLASFPWHLVSKTSVHLAFAGNDTADAKVVTGLTYWAEKDLLLLAGPTLGVVAARLSNSGRHGPMDISLDFRVPLDEAVSALQVDEAKKLLYVLLRSGELIVLDLAENPGAVLQRHRLPRADADIYKDSQVCCALSIRSRYALHGSGALVTTSAPGPRDLGTGKHPSSCTGPCRVTSKTVLVYKRVKGHPDPGVDMSDAENPQKESTLHEEAKLFDRRVKRRLDEVSGGGASCSAPQRPKIFGAWVADKKTEHCDRALMMERFVPTPAMPTVMLVLPIISTMRYKLVIMNVTSAFGQSDPETRPQGKLYASLLTSSIPGRPKWRRTSPGPTEAVLVSLPGRTIRQMADFEVRIDILSKQRLKDGEAANNVINELHRTKDVFLRILPIPADDGIFMSISDASHANDDERSQGGYIRLHHQLLDRAIMES